MISASLSDDWWSSDLRRSISVSASFVALFAFAVSAAWASASFLSVRTSVSCGAGPGGGCVLAALYSSCAMRSYALFNCSWVIFTIFQTFLFFIAISLAPSSLLLTLDEPLLRQPSREAIQFQPAGPLHYVSSPLSLVDPHLRYPPFVLIHAQSSVIWRAPRPFAGTY